MILSTARPIWRRDCEKRGKLTMQPRPVNDASERIIGVAVKGNDLTLQGAALATVMAGLVPATQEHQRWKSRSNAGGGFSSPWRALGFNFRRSVILGGRDKPGHDGGKSLR